MQPVHIPNKVQGARPWLSRQIIGPPPGDEGEGISEIEALHGPERTGTVTRYVFYTHWKPSKAEIQALIDGGTLEIGMYGQTLSPHALAVWPR